MSLQATGNSSYSTQSLQSFIKQAGGLPQSEALKLSGETVTLENLQQQCEGHPELERVVQKFLDNTKDSFAGATTQSHPNSPQELSFNPPKPPTPASAPAPASPNPIQRFESQIEGADVDAWRKLGKGSELDKTLGNTSRQASAIAEIIKTAGALRKDVPQNIDLQLEKDNNFAYAKLYTVDKPAEMGQMIETLQACRDGKLTAPTADQGALLKKLGLEFKDGKLMNLIASTNPPLNAEALDSMIETAKALKPALEGRPGEDNLHVIQVRNKVMAYLNADDRLAKAEQRINTATERVRDASEATAQTAKDIEDAGHELDDIQAQETQIASRVSAGELAIAKLTMVKDQIPLAEPDLAQLNKGLAPFQAEVRIDPQTKGMVFRINNTDATADQVITHIQGKMAQDKDQLAALDQRGHAIQKRLTDLDLTQKTNLANQNAAEAELHHARDEGRNALKLYEEAEAQLPTAADIKSIPGGAGLSALTQTAQQRSKSLRENLKRTEERADQAAALSGRVKTEAGRIQERSQAGLKQYAYGRSKIKAISRMLDQLLPRLNQMAGRMPEIKKNPEQAELDARNAQIRAKVEALAEQADQLQARLQLAQAPVYKDLDKIGSDLEKLLNQIQNEFKSIDHHVENHDHVQRSTTNTHTLKLLDNSAYHARKLKELTSHSKEEKARLLTEAIKQIRGNLFVANSLQSA